MFEHSVRNQALAGEPDKQTFGSVALRLLGAIGAVGMVGGSSILVLMLLGKAMAWAAVAVFGPVVAFEIVGLPLLRKKVRDSPLLRSLVDSLQVVAIYTLPLQATFFTTMAFVALAMITGHDTSSSEAAAYTYEFVSFSVMVFIFLFGFGGLGFAGVLQAQHDGPNLRWAHRLLGWTLIALSIAILYPGLVWTNHWLEALAQSMGPLWASLAVFGGEALVSVLLSGAFFLSVTPSIQGLAFHGPSGLVALARKNQTTILSLDGKSHGVFRVRVLAFNGDGTSMAGTTRYGDIEVFDVSSGRMTTHIQALKNDPRALAFSPDSRRIATLDDDGWLQVWALPEGRMEWEQDCGKSVNDPISLAFDPSGVTILVGTGQAKLVRYESSGGLLLEAATDFAKDFGHEQFASVRISPTGRSLVVKDQSKATAYTIQGAQITRTIQNATLGESVIVRSACDAEADTLAIGAEQCRVFFKNKAPWDLDTGMDELALDQMGRRLVTATKKQVLLWDIETREKTRLL